MNYSVKINETVDRVRAFSFGEKKEAVWDEQKINRFLDTILEFKRLLSDKTSKIDDMVNKIEEITWFDNVDKKSLMLINDLIASIRDVHHTLIRQYISMQRIRSKGIARQEFKAFKSSIDDLKELANDLESTFFFLPNMPEFKETTLQLSLV